MRALLVAILLVVPLALASTATPRTETRTYVGPTHDTTARFVSCAIPAPLALDGACFPLDGTATNADITLQDATGLSILAHVFFRDPHGIAIGADDFVCTNAWNGPVPAAAVSLAVWLLPDPGVNTPGNCPLLHGQATVGTVTAQLS